MQIYCFPKRIISRIEGPIILVKLVRKDQNEIFFVHVGLHGQRLLWCVLIDETIVAWEVGYLTCRVNPAKIESTLSIGFLFREMCQQGVACKYVSGF